MPSVSDLGVFRTPLEPAPRLAERLGLRPGDLWIKRDDYLGFGGGGNKLRKLEHLVGDAVERGGCAWLRHLRGGDPRAGP